MLDGLLQLVNPVVDRGHFVIEIRLRNLLVGRAASSAAGRPGGPAAAAIAGAIAGAIAAAMF